MQGNQLLSLLTCLNHDMVAAVGSSVLHDKNKGYNTTPSPDNLLMSIPALTIDDLVLAVKELAPKKSCWEDEIAAFIVKGYCYLGSCIAVHF